MFNLDIEGLNDNLEIFNFSKEKPKDWIEILNNSKKPFLLFINRAFLTSQQKYKNLKKSISFIIHDECHSINNKTTQTFYNYISNYKVIGLSATPLNIYPFEKIIHRYTLYDALIQKDLVTPQIVWLTKEKRLTNNEIMYEVSNIMNNLPFKKIIIWCGLIKQCKELARLWQDYFKNFNICIDTSCEETVQNIGNYDDFKNLKSNGFLFCAAKHREGSDIKNLDGCIFMDRVSKRTPKTFIHC